MNAAYQYWLVRYVPDVARGERVNVAVIVGRDGGDWAIEVASNLRRASRLGGDASVLRPWIERLRKAIQDHQSPPLGMFASEDDAVVSRAWLNLLSHRYNNSLQVSEAAPVDAVTAADGAAFLFRTLVNAPVQMGRSNTRLGILKDLTALYEHSASLELGGSLLRSPKITAGKQRGRFDFAVVENGVGQLSQAFAFDVRDLDALEREIQSWNFVVSRVRASGAQIVVGEQLQQVEGNVPIAVAYQEPERLDAHTIDIFDAALEAWKANEVLAVPSSQLEKIALGAIAH